jgi:hypothetical protein
MIRNASNRPGAVFADRGRVHGGHGAVFRGVSALTGVSTSDGTHLADERVMYVALARDFSIRPFTKRSETTEGLLQIPLI